MFSGGVAVGSAILIEEDSFGQYAKLLLQYFLAESVMTGQSVFLASAGIHPKNILKDLPQPVLDETHATRDTQVQSDQMKIAWRYQHQNKFESNPTSVKFGHYYDLTHCMNEELINKVSMTLVDVSQLIDSSQLQDVHKVKEPKHCAYEKLLQCIQETIIKRQFRTQDKPAKRNILRIALHSVGSPLWGDLSTCDVGGSSPEMDIMLPRFFLGLRYILRSAFAVAMITVPSHIFHDPGFVRRIERLSDTVVQLESFADSIKARNPLYKDYHGLLNIKQLPKLNSIKCQMPDVTDWAFKLKRKKLVIEILDKIQRKMCNFISPDLVLETVVEDDGLNSHNVNKIKKDEKLDRYQEKFVHRLDWMSTMNAIKKSLHCDICDFAVSCKSKLEQHMRKHTGVKPFPCEVCERKFSQSSTLKRHMLTHTGEKPFPCVFCGAKFSQSSHLKSHILIHTDERPYHCEVCEAKFSQNSALKTHMRTHTGEKPFHCGVCGASFAGNSTLKRHMRTHTKEKPFQCEICEARFSHSSTLKQHIFIHTGEKPFRCEVCEASFSHSSSLQKHILTHTGEKPFHCEHCGAKFSQLSGLKPHILSHTGEKPFQCEVCDAKFSRSSSLRRHKTTHDK